MINQHFYKSIHEYEFVVFDLETTGGRPENNGITEIAAHIVKGDRVIDKFHSMVNPQTYLSPIVRKITGIKPHMVANAPKIEAVMPGFLEFIGNRVVVSHNTVGDVKFLDYYCKQVTDSPFKNFYLCTHLLVEKLYPEAPSKSLTGLGSLFELTSEDDEFHRADFDTKITHGVLLKCFERIQPDDIKVLDILRYQGETETLKRMGWNIKKSKFSNGEKRPGIFVLKDENEKPLFLAATQNIKRDLNRLQDIPQLPKQIVKVMASAKDILPIYYDNFTQAELDEVEMVNQNEKIKIEPHRWHGRRNEFVCLQKKNNKWRLLPASINKDVKLAFGPIRDHAGLKLRLKEVVKILYGNVALNDIPYKQSDNKKIEQLIKEHVASKLVQSEQVLSNIHTGILKQESGFSIFIYKGFYICSSEQDSLKLRLKAAFLTMLYTVGFSPKLTSKRARYINLVIGWCYQRRFHFYKF